MGMGLLLTGRSLADCRRGVATAKGNKRGQTSPTIRLRYQLAEGYLSIATQGDEPRRASDYMHGQGGDFEMS